MDRRIATDILLDLCVPEKRRGAVFKLCALASVKENRNALVQEHGIVAPLLIVVKEDGGQAREKACEALHWLALEDANVEHMVNECGVVEPLLSVIRQSGTGEAHIYACAAINSLCTKASVRETLVQDCNVVDTLLDVSRTPGPAQIYGLGSLHWLSHNPRNVVSLLLAGVVPVMLRVVSSEAEKLRDQALGVIASMAFHGDVIVRQHITVRKELQGMGIVPVLTRLQELNDGVGVVATVTLANIIGRDNALNERQAIRTHRVIELFGVALDEGRMFGLVWPLRVPLTAIRNLSVSDTHKAALGSKNVIGALIRVVREHVTVAKHVDSAPLAFVALLELSFMVSDDASLRKSWLVDTGDQTLPNLLRAYLSNPGDSSTIESRQAAACLLYRLDPTPPPTNASDSDTTTTATTATTATTPIAAEETTKRVFVSCPSIYSTHGNALASALETLGYLVWHPASRNVEPETKAIEVLVDQLHRSCAIVICASQAHKESTLSRFEATLATTLPNPLEIVLVNTDESFRISGWVEDLTTTSLWYPAWDCDKMSVSASSIAQVLGDRGKKSNRKTHTPLATLSVDEVGQLLGKLHLAKYAKVFAENEVDGQTLAECLNEADVVSLGVELRPHARKLLKQVGTFLAEGVPVEMLSTDAAGGDGNNTSE